MLRVHPARRRPRCHGPMLCAAAAALLLLLSLSVLHARLSSSPLRLPLRRTPSFDSDLGTALFDDADNDAFDPGADDRIDELDDIEDEDAADGARRRSVGDEEDDSLPDSDSNTNDPDPMPRGGLFWDHVAGAARRSFGRGDRDRLVLSGSESNGYSPPDEEDQRKIKTAFGSDDEPVDEVVRAKLDSIDRIEDVLLLNGGRESTLREGWAKWLEGKADFLRRDRMLRSNLERLHPKNHPLLQDPDGPGLTSLTRGDRLMQAALWKELEKNPFVGQYHRGIKKADQRSTLALEDKKSPLDNIPKAHSTRTIVLKEEERYADGRRWGYFPGLDPHLPFSEFMERFLGDRRCGMRVFMVWNSPPWMYSVRHQRGLESLLYHHKDACVVVFSETMELDFFRDFVKDGFRIAVVMPNLDELLKDTPTHVFASVWFEWRKTKHYPIHYSELVRLAALYKYGGTYLDSDVIVLNPIHTFKNSIGIEDQVGGNSTYNGAVMSFQRHSPFLKECLGEFYSTYDDTLLRWNGAELMTRVVNRLISKGDRSYRQLDIKIEPPFAFFPISSQDITRYFVAASDAIEKAQHDALLTKIRNESITLHFWNSLTSALVPEPESLVERLINQHCLHCLDVL